MLYGIVATRKKLFPSYEPHRRHVHTCTHSHTRTRARSVTRNCMMDKLSSRKYPTLIDHVREEKASILRFIRDEKNLNTLTCHKRRLDRVLC